uniref:Uncharacterized protein n=1 Tax=Oryza rufipogon TaxID=4529 RepID=A0A0E0RHY1_ORYRU
MAVTWMSGGGQRPSGEIGWPRRTRCGAGDAANAYGGATRQRRMASTTQSLVVRHGPLRRPGGAAAWHSVATLSRGQIGSAAADHIGGEAAGLGQRAVAGVVGLRRAAMALQMLTLRGSIKWCSGF